MKIVFNDGESQDTDKLSDKEAALLEAINHLYNVCKQFNATAFARIMLDKQRFIGMSNTIKSSDQKLIQQESSDLIVSIGSWISKATNGKVGLAIQVDGDDKI